MTADDVAEYVAGITAREVDWDSYGGLPTTEQAQDVARRLVESIGAWPYHGGPLPNGGIGVEYRGDHGEIEVWIAGSGACDILDMPRNGQRLERDGLTFEETVSVVRPYLNAQ